ncbi:mitogen-activated protein kinase kinase kinase mlk-1-like [Penaeus japonicus]|uniref:mitogen-activated protein kinase kinase kinase mlk-1-like n=1 Tax=Penaeus japonicus TaxID=27405 RepID=UPI001C716A99|nr:mitogen-activated protein kinase kinase kinase mlk-1-like [Penaeus japonicus]
MMLNEQEVSALVSQGELLGQGSFAKAFRVRYQGRYAVVKVAKLRDSAFSFKEEVGTMLIMNGLAGVPRVLALCEDYPGFLMEFCKGKTLRRMLLDDDPVEIVIRGIYDLALKVRQIHRRGYAHNDLKLDNVVVKPSADGREVTARVIDLGLCTRLGVSPGFQGEPEDFRHIAPELLKMGVATVESELFALGNILDLAVQWYSESFPEDCELRHLAQAMTCPDPHWRPDFQMCLDVLADNLDVPLQE